MRRTHVFFCAHILVFAVMESSSLMHVLLVCEKDIAEMCQRTVTFYHRTEDTNESSFLNISLVTDLGSFDNGVKFLGQYVKEGNISVIIGFGDSFVVNLAAIAAKNFGIPLLQYSTSKQRNAMYPELTIVFNPTVSELSKAITSLVGEDIIKHAYVIVLDSLVTDGFFGGDDSNNSRSKQRLILSDEETDYQLQLRLVSLEDSGYRLIVMHSTPSFFQRFVSIANKMNFFASGFAWILTESIFAPYGHSLRNLPYGLLAIEGYEVNHYDVIIQEMISSVEQAMTSIGDDDLSPYDIRPDFLMRSVRSNTAIFNTDGSRKHVQFRLLNYILDSDSSQLTWKEVGFIQDDNLDLQTVVWPGQTIFGPIGTAREHYTVVTRPAEPFVFARGPVSSGNDCTAATACLHLYTHKPLEIKAAVENFRQNKQIKNISYDIYCCEGIVVDVLNQLALDLNFDFHLYFQNDTNYGTYQNNQWTGMAGDVFNGAADIMAGAISITSDRMEAVTFTEPYYYAGFNMLSKNFDRVTSILAFLSPFETELWITIVASAIVVAIATSLLEWNSPFGLSPWGRRRKKNYTLGSGLTMVFSLWFGHTVSTKTPKSWPSKVLQNFWAAFSIFSIASYTANLAAYLAGNAYSDSTYSILDTKLTSKRIGVMRTSAVEEFTKSINGDLYSRLNTYVSSVEEAVQKLRSDEIDLYMDDSPILEYALSRIDNNCSVKYAAHSFGENAYGFGLPKGSWLKAKVDPLLLNYVELGLVENLKWRYLGKTRLCESAIGMMLSARTTQYSLDHTGGLFLVLLVAVGISFLILIFEHIMYFVLLPRLKKMPSTSIWKNRNVEFFSQRLYRAINTVTVRPAAKSFVQKVRAKKFNVKLRTAQSRSVPANLNEYDNADGTVANLAGRVALRMFTRDYIHYDRDMRRRVFTICSGSLDSGLLQDIPEVNNIDEISQNNKSTEQLLPIKHLKSNSSPNDMYLSFDNPVFESDFEVGNCSRNETSLNLPEKTKKDPLPKMVNITRNCSDNQCRQTNYNGIVMKGDSDNTPTESSEQMTRCRRYETWPSPKARKKSLKRSAYQPSSFSTADQHCPYCKSNGKSDNHNTFVSHRLADVGDGNSQAYKDNRFKSSLRRHAMSGSHCSNSLDACAVESLSKEDLLILWKRAEIELQTKLNRIISQNNHLRRMIDIAEEADSRRSSLQENVDENNEDCFKVTKL